MITLTVSHSIYLTRQQRYALYNGDTIEVVGISVPVWIRDGKTSEPAEEIFTKYVLKNQEERIFLKQDNGHYELSIPKDEKSPNPPLPDNIWNSLTPEAQEKWYEQNEPNPSLKNLLDVKDGGSEWLAFRQYTAKKIPNNTIMLNIIHFIEVKDMEELLNTM